MDVCVRDGVDIAREEAAGFGDGVEIGGLAEGFGGAEVGALGLGLAVYVADVLVGC